MKGGTRRDTANQRYSKFSSFQVPVFKKPRGESGENLEGNPYTDLIKKGLGNRVPAPLSQAPNVVYFKE